MIEIRSITHEELRKSYFDGKGFVFVSTQPCLDGSVEALANVLINSQHKCTNELPVVVLKPTASVFVFIYENFNMPDFFGRAKPVCDFFMQNMASVMTIKEYMDSIV